MDPEGDVGEGPGVPVPAGRCPGDEGDSNQRWMGHGRAQLDGYLGSRLGFAQPHTRAWCIFTFASSVCALGRGEGGCGVLTCGFLQTSTYQAVLSTDGNQSFALLLYQDGAMRWDYAGLAAGNVLIGFSRCPAFWDTPYSSTVLGPPRHLLPRRAQLPPRPTPSLLTPLSANWQEKPTEPPSLKPGHALCAEPSPRWAGSSDRGVGGRPQPKPNPKPTLFTQR